MPRNPPSDKPDLALLIAEWRAHTISPSRSDELVDQVGRIISWRLRRVHGSGHGRAWHDMHQECWGGFIRWLNGPMPIRGKVSTLITSIVDGTVMRNHKAQTTLTWECGIEAVERMAHKLNGARKRGEQVAAVDVIHRDGVPDSE